VFEEPSYVTSRMKSPLTGAIGPVQDKSGKNKKQVHSYPAVTNDPVSIGFTD
jgi:hypothetical protein